MLSSGDLIECARIASNTVLELKTANIEANGLRVVTAILLSGVADARGIDVIDEAIGCALLANALEAQISEAQERRAARAAEAEAEAPPPEAEPT